MSASNDFETLIGAAGGDLTGTYLNPTIGNGKVTGAKIAAATIPASKLAAAARAVATGLHLGSNGAGPVTVTRALLNQAVVGAINLTDGSDALASFESTVSVAGQVQQTDAANLSAKKILFILQG